MIKLDHDGWAFLPEDKRPDRLIRFFTGYTGDELAKVCNQNVLLVNKQFYDALDSIDQGRVLATHADLRAVVRDGKVSIA